jgi:protocatechuate 4,5-dioxygenase alpha subunit
MTDPGPRRLMVFDGAMSQRGYRINRFAKTLTTPAGRDAFSADPRGSMAGFGLTGDEMDLIQNQQWQALLERGGSIYLLAKIAIAMGGTLYHVGAQMRGQTHAEFVQAISAARADRA